MFILLIVIIALIGLLLGVIILLQSGKGGGLAGIAAGGATQQVLGARTAPDILEKATWTLGAMFILLCVLTNFTIDKGDAAESVIQQGQTTQETLPVLPPPDAGAIQPNAGATQPDAGAAQPPPSGGSEQSADEPPVE